jgi:hypothetical protein
VLAFLQNIVQVAEAVPSLSHNDTAMVRRATPTTKAHLNFKAEFFVYFKKDQ